MNSSVRLNQRWEKIIHLVNEQGYLSVKELGHLCDASEITIRRDLESLAEQKKILRIHGGAASLKNHTYKSGQQNQPGSGPTAGYWLEHLDALIITSNNDRLSSILPDIATGNFPPVIAEATPFAQAATCVTVDNYEAGKAMGRWAGEYTRKFWEGQAFILDLTYHLPNTIERSRGFLDGVREIVPTAQAVLSLNAHSRHATAYQLTKDAVSTDPRINIIFAINDQSAQGALQACHDLNLDPEKLMVIPFGLEGSTLLNQLVSSPFCKAGLAMFPEIVSKVCLAAALQAYNRQPLPPKWVTPFAVIEKGTLARYYRREDGEWKLQPEIIEKLAAPLPSGSAKQRRAGKSLRRIGIAVSFIEHEWYKNLYNAMVGYGKQYGINISLVDAEQTLKDEIELRRREIAQQAAGDVHPGDVILIDASPIAAYLADALARTKDLTVITNSMAVLERLKNCPEITLVGTGGVLRQSSQAFVGPSAEANLREMRADNLFLSVSGVSVDFGLSHTNISEVTIKQMMIQSARRVTLLADHSMFVTESTIQVAPLNVVHTLITDDALPASSRLNISQRGIQVTVAGM